MCGFCSHVLVRVCVCVCVCVCVWQESCNYSIKNSYRSIRNRQTIQFCETGKKKNVNRIFTKEDIQMANKQNRREKVHNVITHQANVCIKTTEFKGPK